MTSKSRKHKIEILSKIIFILIFIRWLLWLKTSTTLAILASTVIYKLIKRTQKASAYPETHYVLARRLSLIYRNYPEVITDAPWRIKAGEPIPILYIIKDADKFPVELTDITVDIQGEGIKSKKRLRYPDDRIMEVISNLDPGRSITPKKGLIDSRYWYNLVYISIPEDYFGWLKISPKISLISEKIRLFRRNKIVKSTISTDNLPTLSHKPLRVYVSKHDLPSFEGWYYGDTHCHSDRTDSQTEFGAPPIAIRSMGKAIGLKWTTITDHSYDLDTPVNQLFGIDPKRLRWKSLKSEIDLANSLANDFLLMRGEEISCGNANEENIHLLAYGVPEFIPGRGDGCKELYSLYDFTNPPDITLTDALKKIRENHGLGFAAHPDSNSHRLAKFFLNRGVWQEEDCKIDGCLGLQIWYSCGSTDTFEKSYKRWINLLLDGHKSYIIAGSDAHGDFNRYRYVEHPFFKLREKRDSYFGKPRTCVYCGSTVNDKTVLRGLRYGKSVVTDGPIAIFELVRDDGKKAMLGETISERKFELMLKVKSTEEFGELQKAVIYKGELSKKREIVWKQIELKHLKDPYSHVSEQTVKIDNDCYIRVEAMSKKKKKIYRCLTNPIWIEGGKNQKLSNER